LEFRNGKDGGIDFPSESLLRWAKPCHELRERGPAQYHEVRVAGGALSLTGDRSVHERNRDFACERCQRRPQDIANTNGFCDQAFKFAKDRAPPVRLKNNLIAPMRTQNQAEVRELLQFSLDGAVAGVHRPGKLAKLKGFVGIAEEQGGAGASE
jgi:hypothetical protein